MLVTSPADTRGCGISFAVRENGDVADLTGAVGPQGPKDDAWETWPQCPARAGKRVDIFNRPGNVFYENALAVV